MPGTDLNIISGTSFHVNGLTLVPSSDFTLNNISLTKNNRNTNYIGHPTIARYYKFSNTTNPFDGIASVYYQDEELNGGTSANLNLEIHNGINWNISSLDQNDFFNKVVTSQKFSNSLNEITLADLSIIPSLKVIGNPITNGILKFKINTESTVSLYSFEGLPIWSKKLQPGIYNEPVSNLFAGSYVLKANQLSQTVLIIK